jgi:acyl-coenzyme A synthetase/AMP-(fatty) acid ligase
MNYSRDIVGRVDPSAEALIAIDGEGRRRVWSFGELDDRSARLATTLREHGVQRGNVVMTLIGNRAEWVLTLLACFRIGAAALPCTEQLRAKDLAQRLRVADPAIVVADERNATELTAAGPSCPVLLVPDDGLFTAAPAAPIELAADDPALVIFTSGTSGEPKAVVHGQRYLFGQGLQAEHWLDARPGDLVWCTAAAGWSKSARNTFIAPWLRGARALLHDARFDADQRLNLLEAEGVDVLCMAPTEYRIIANRSTPRPLPRLRNAVAAGEALNPEIIGVWEQTAGIAIRDGYGQTETGAVTAMPPGVRRHGSMGRALPGVELHVRDGRLLVDPTTLPTFFLGYLGDAPPEGLWETGDLVDRDEDGFLWFRGRADDVIVSSGYRIGPVEVEAALSSHPAVAEAAVVGARDDERGEIVRAVVVLRDGWSASDALAAALQDHVKAATAPYKHPRVVDFASSLPRTASGKVRRRALREPIDEEPST